jgi:hypothetical protein
MTFYASKRTATSHMIESPFIPKRILPVFRNYLLGLSRATKNDLFVGEKGEPP